MFPRRHSFCANTKFVSFIKIFLEHQKLFKMSLISNLSYLNKKFTVYSKQLWTSCTFLVMPSVWAVQEWIYQKTNSREIIQPCWKCSHLVCQLYLFVSVLPAYWVFNNRDRCLTQTKYSAPWICCVHLQASHVFHNAWLHLMTRCKEA